MLLRITSKIKLDAGWRAGLLAEVPFVDKRTTTIESSDSGNSSSSENKFGIGDAAFQAYLAHDFDQNWAFGFGGDPARRNIRQAQISPKLNIGLSERWFITLYPSYDVRINYGPSVPGQTGRLFLPFDVAVGREISKGVLLSLEVSVPIIRDFPVYNFKSELRMVARF